MRTALRLALAALAIPVVARAGGTPEWAGRYMAEYSARAAGTANGAIPSFSRQTGLACNVCHIAFPQLTAFGRLFNTKQRLARNPSVLARPIPVSGILFGLTDDYLESVIF